MIEIKGRKFTPRDIEKFLWLLHCCFDSHAADSELSIQAITEWMLYKAMLNISRLEPDEEEES